MSCRKSALPAAAWTAKPLSGCRASSSKRARRDADEGRALRLASSLGLAGPVEICMQPSEQSASLVPRRALRWKRVASSRPFDGNGTAATLQRPAKTLQRPPLLRSAQSNQKKNYDTTTFT